MFFEPAERHHVPHFHATFQGATGIFAINPVVLIAGELPSREQRLVEAWAGLHGNDLLAGWEALQAGRRPKKIAPVEHPTQRVKAFEQLGTYVLRVDFEDGSSQVIDFKAVLEGELFGPLRDPARFSQVALDPETRTLVWPSGVDFDAATLHEWPVYEASLRASARRWKRSTRAQK
jgi:hypothetical protein